MIPGKVLGEQRIAQNTAMIKDIIDSYLYERNWEVKENANVNKTFTGLIHYAVLKLFREYALSYVYSEEAPYHLGGDLHIHDLPFSPFIGYCAGWSMEKLLKKGLITNTVTARPARHLDSAVDHITNFLVTAQHEWAGAQAFSNVALYLGPFVKEDKIGEYERIKQQVQRLIFNLNFPSRVGSQTPFTNFTFTLDAVPEILEKPAIIGGKEVGTLGDYVEEGMKIFRAFIEVYSEGDSSGRPFTFPIPTLVVSKNFDWNGTRWGEISEMIWDLSAQRGSWYFLNGVNGVDPSSTLAMCCRLTIRKKDLQRFIVPRKEEIENGWLRERHMGGVWAMPDETGSLGVVTINMSRIGFLAKGEEEKVYEALDHLLEVARGHLMKKRERISKILSSKLLDLRITSEYLDTLQNHFNTIGLTALPEFAANFLRDPDLWENFEGRGKEVISLYERVLKHVLRKLEEFSSEDGVRYNLEETPAEGAGPRLARADLSRFKEEFEHGEFFIPIVDGEPFYSNSIVPYYAKVSLAERISIEGRIQKYFTGGVMMHVFLGEAPDPGALKSLAHRIIHRTQVIYFSFTPAQSICPKCGWRGTGVHFECPRCGAETEVWSRIVGYYRPISRWNSGRRAEFKSRFHYSSDEVL